MTGASACRNYAPQSSGNAPMETEPWIQGLSAADSQRIPRQTRSDANENEGFTPPWGTAARHQGSL
ncbi:hypothetical protein GCM10010503_04340 [Streptomyces lucensis JCM 4490]|uniref:Uncharacterized protein n=1 Tax=Streptomyces lucensis JCM 4490 TaxID=1306176 RepID=A0A918ITU8_9ACTN|nr:hypothetical protein GCM10010503_04340 [Streptomyces lucensis JCM 4490]